MYSNANIYRKSDDKLIEMVSGWWNVHSLTCAARRLMESKGENFDDYYVVCLDNQSHTASRPHHIVDGKVKRYAVK